MTEWGAADGAAVRSPDRHPMTDGGAEEEEPDEAPEVPDVSNLEAAEAGYESLVAVLGDAHQAAREGDAETAGSLSGLAVLIAEDLEADR